DSGSGDRQTLDPPDPDVGPQEDIIRKEMHEQLRRVLSEFDQSLECIDRVILRNKLADRRVTHCEIVQQAVRDCGYKKRSERTIQNHWRQLQEDLKDQLRQRLKPLDEPE